MQKRPPASFYVPILVALHEMGGIGKTAEVVRRVIKQCGITEEELVKHGLSTGIPLIRKRIEFARFHLINTGYIHSPERGVWMLTDKGRAAKLDSSAMDAIHQEVLKVWRRSSPTDASSTADASSIEEDAGPGVPDPRDELLGRLLKMPPHQFEKICRHLLMRVGFEDVEVTRKTRDGGFDGNGLLVVNPFVKTPFIFECKRYTNTLVQVHDVRALQGKISQGAGEKGAIITTSYFTAAAREEAKTPPSNRIELVEQDELIDLFVAHRVGVRVAEHIEEIDDDFFRDYQD